MNNVLKDYANLLCLYWSAVKKLESSDTTESFKNDWLQANWELIVERQLGGFDLYLEAYGDGADCNGESSRVLFPKKQATHNIILSPKNEDKIYGFLGEGDIDNTFGEVIFQRFVTIKENGWYYEEPPFDMIEAFYRDQVIIVEFDTVNAKLGIISSEGNSEWHI